ncbi:PAS domain-containing protein [Acetobacteraceae bacterium H6797]|nr:PAS domain-containing protein [Acetobacteraceae bacterium H6797]
MSSPATLPRLTGATFLIAGVPAAALAALVITGRLGALEGFLALVATFLSAAILAWLWLESLARLTQAMRRAMEGPMEGLPAPPPLLPAAADVAEEVHRITRSLAERSALVGQLRRADAAIIEALPDPLVVLGADRAPLRANRAARRLFGLSENGGAGGDLAALLRHPKLASAIDRALAEGAAQSADVVLPVPVLRDLSAQVIPLDPPLSDGGRMLVVLVDRTRERAVERMRADFVANVSHELRTPLASVMGFIETLRGPARGDTEAADRFLGIMSEQSDRMRRLIDDLLDLSRIELVEHQPPDGECDLGQLVRAELEGMSPIIAARGATVLTDLVEGCIARPADAGQVGQVLRNLLENALRYGRKEGTTRILLRPAAPGGLVGGTRLPNRPGHLLSVTDDGPGIPREHIPRLTERFYRVDKGRARHAGGTGLGLAIVKHVVNRHRGLLVIESEEGQGATFTVWLPGAQEAER